MKLLFWTLPALVAFGWATQATAGDKGTPVDLGGLKSTTPASWKTREFDTKVVGKFRIYDFALPKAKNDKEDADLILTFLGAGSGGSTDANIKRWKASMAAPPGKSIDDLTKVTEFKVGDVPVTYVEITGTYLSKFPPFSPNAKVTPKEDFVFIGVIFDSKNGPFFMRLTGPAATVEAHKKGFDEWLKGFK